VCSFGSGVNGGERVVRSHGDESYRGGWGWWLGSVSRVKEGAREGGWGRARRAIERVPRGFFRRSVPHSSGYLKGVNTTCRGGATTSRRPWWTPMAGVGHTGRSASFRRAATSSLVIDAMGWRAVQ
jgi:hypothetical protein